jgi:6-phosphofructokinase 1
VRRLGEPGIVSPMAGLLQSRASSPHYVHELDRVLLDDTVDGAAARLCDVADLPSLEPGGPREYIYFDPAATRAAIVTCGGLCPGLNNVIRGLVLELADNYGVTEVLGFRDGFRGLGGDIEPVRLTHDLVSGIHNRGGTILGTSRGNQDSSRMVTTLQHYGVSLLFVIGGDGTLRGAAKIADEAERRGMKLAVIGSVSANGWDAVYCLRLAQAAVHAAMAGRTAMVVGRWHGRFVHIPIPVATGGRNQVDPNGDLWMSVLEATGQPERLS